MKKFLFYAMMLIFALGCTNNNSAAKKEAKKLIERLVEEDEDISIKDLKISDLYILTPKDINALPEPQKTGNPFEDFFNSYDGISTLLNLAGCTEHVMTKIVDNDKIFNKYNTGAKEYVLIAFWTEYDEYYKENEECSLCVVFSESMNITETYNISDPNFIYIKLFGQDEAHFYGAVDEVYERLENAYDKYSEYLEDEKLSIEFRYSIVEDFNNKLFGYEKYSILENKEETIQKCLDDMDYSSDQRELKDKAYLTVKSL